MFQYDEKENRAPDLLHYCGHPSTAWSLPLCAIWSAARRKSKQNQKNPRFNPRSAELADLAVWSGIFYFAAIRKWGEYTAWYWIYWRLLYPFFEDWQKNSGRQRGLRIDYISAVRPLCRAAANAKETDLQTIIFMNRNTLCIRFFYMNCTISVNTTTIAAEIPKMGGGIAMKATGIVRRIDDLGRVVIPKEIRRTLRIREGDPLQMTLAPWEKFCFAVSNLAKRNGWS